MGKLQSGGVPLLAEKNGVSATRGIVARSRKKWRVEGEPSGRLPPQLRAKVQCPARGPMRRLSHRTTVRAGRTVCGVDRFCAAARMPAQATTCPRLNESPWETGEHE